MNALRDFDLFLLVADCGSLTAAARRLEITPAAASIGLKRLEAELGVQLFLRSTRSLRLTDEGQVYLEPVSYTHLDWYKRQCQGCELTDEGA